MARGLAVMHTTIGCLLLTGLTAGPSTAQTSQQEAEYYAVDYLVPPEGTRVEVGGMAFLPDGRLVLSTRRGQVWMVENPLAKDPKDARFSLFAEGLWEGLGLAVVPSGVPGHDADIVVMQRQELSRLYDDDHDGRCDRIDTLCDAWGVSDNYHEFGYGLPVDAQGNYYISLNVSFFSPKWWHGKSPVPYRGWTLQISPTGKLTPLASGFRSPCGISLSPEGDLFVTDNQGDWMPASPIYHVQPGRFYGHPASLDWTEEYRKTDTHASDTVPPARAASDRARAAIWLPYKWSRSPGNQAWDLTGGKFGPFGGQFMLAEMTNGMVIRGALEKVEGEYQGWCVPLRQRVGSAVRVLFAEDGTLLAGLTNRGWGGYSPADGVARVRWTGQTPMEITRVSPYADLRMGGGGFRIRFTKEYELPERIEVVQYDYDYWWEYGSPERDLTPLAVRDDSAASSDTREMLVAVPGLAAGRMTRVRLHGLKARDGTPLLHDEFAYTLNQLPGAPRTDRMIARLVPPPPARESGSEGWLFLTWGDALGRWSSTGWTLCDAELDTADRTRFTTKEGNGALVNVGPSPSPFVSKEVFGDSKIHLRFQLPEKGNSGLYVMGRYEVQLLDSAGKTPDQLTMGDCGGIYRGNTWPGRAPDFNAFREAGQWHDLDVEFQAPRFDAAGKKTENARFLRIRIDDVLLHENVEVPEPTLGALFADEAPLGPLMVQGDHTQVAIADVRVFPKVPKLEPEGWEPLFDGSTLDGWKISDDGDWTVEDGVIIGQGKTSHLFSPRGDYEDFEVRGRFKISDGGNSGFYFRTGYAPGWPPGYEAQINSTFTDPQKVASLYDRVKNGTTLVPPDTWFDYRVRCVDEAAGTHITIWLNEVVFVDWIDAERKYTSGHIALQQHHEGSVIEARDLWIREL
ncbi:MAG TPA: family 16 glycoside hydrolase [Planctomycetota bacterium]